MWLRDKYDRFMTMKDERMTLKKGKERSDEI